ncbi:hypothetical protein PLESTM_001218200 [Pleodorina starrii]|nr:hypothetical protein PLESTM_001218200 [Pleodorina starrii]
MEGRQVSRDDHARAVMALEPSGRETRNQCAAQLRVGSSAGARQAMATGGGRTDCSGSTRRAPLADDAHPFRPLSVAESDDRVPGSGGTPLFGRNRHTIMSALIDVPLSQHGRRGFTSPSHRHTVYVAGAQGAHPQGDSDPSAADAQSCWEVALGYEAPRGNPGSGSQLHGQHLRPHLPSHAQNRRQPPLREPHQGPPRQQREAELQQGLQRLLAGDNGSEGDGLERRQHDTGQQHPQQQQQQQWHGELVPMQRPQHRNRKNPQPAPQQRHAAAEAEQRPNRRNQLQEGSTPWSALQDGAAAPSQGVNTASEPLQGAPTADGQPRRQRRGPSGPASYVDGYTVGARGGSQARSKRRRTELEGDGAPDGDEEPPRPRLPPLQLMRDVGRPPGAPAPASLCGSGRVGAGGRGAEAPAPAWQLHAQPPTVFLSAGRRTVPDPDGDAARGGGGDALAVRHPLPGIGTAALATGRSPLAGGHLGDALQHRRPQRYRSMSELILLPEVKLKPQPGISTDADVADEDAREGSDGGEEEGGSAAAAAEPSQGPSDAREGAAGAGEAPPAPVAAATLRAAPRQTHIAVVQKGLNQVKVSIPVARLLFPDALPKMAAGVGYPIELYLAVPQPRPRPPCGARPSRPAETDGGGAGALDEGDGNGAARMLRLQRLEGIQLLGHSIAWALTGLSGMIRALGLANCERVMLTAVPATTPAQRRRRGDGDNGGDESNVAGGGVEEELPVVIISRGSSPPDAAAATASDATGPTLWAHNYSGLLTVPPTLAQRLFPRVAASGREATLPVRAAARLPGETELRTYAGVCLRGLFHRIMLTGLRPALQQLGVCPGESLFLREEPGGRMALVRQKHAAGRWAVISGAAGTEEGLELRSARRGRRARRATDASEAGDAKGNAVKAGGGAGTAGAGDGDAGSFWDVMEDGSGSEGGAEDGRRWVGGVRATCRSKLTLRGAASEDRAAAQSGADDAAAASAAGAAAAEAAVAGGSGGTQAASLRVSASASAAAAALLAMPPFLSPSAAAAGAAAAAQDAASPHPQRRQSGPEVEADVPPLGPAAWTAAAADPAAPQAPEVVEDAADADAACSFEIPLGQIVFLDGRGRGAAGATGAGPPRGAVALGDPHPFVGDITLQQAGSAPDLGPADASAVGDEYDEYDRGYYSGYQEGYCDGYGDGFDAINMASALSGGRSRGDDGPLRAAQDLGWERSPGDEGAPVGSDGRGFAAAASVAAVAPPPRGSGAISVPRFAVVPLGSLASGTAAAPPASAAIRVVQLPSGRPRGRDVISGLAGVQPAPRLSPPPPPQQQQQPPQPQPPQQRSRRLCPALAEAEAWAAELRLREESARVDGLAPAQAAPLYPYRAQLATAAAWRHVAPATASTDAAAAAAPPPPDDLELLLGLWRPPAGGGGGGAAPPLRQQ